METFTASYQVKSHRKGDDAHADEHVDCRRMASAFVIIGRVYRCQFKYNYLRNQIHFAAFFIAFLESTSNFEHFEKK